MPETESYVPTQALREYMQANIGDNLQPAVVGVCAFLLVIAYCAVALRFLARWKTRTSISYDDYAIVIALILVTGSNITISHSTVYGFGRHVLLVTDKKGLIASEIATQVLYTCSLPPIKISILCLYHRLFPSAKLYRLSIGVGIFIIAYSIIQAVCMITQCLPLEDFLSGDPDKLPNLRCINFAVVLMFCSVLNVLTDFVILSMPIPFIWNLKVELSKRIQLIATFTVGVFVTGISIARTVLVAQPSTADKSWVDVGPALISMTEIAIGILCACLPTYRPLLRKRVAKHASGSHSQYRHASSKTTSSSAAKSSAARQSHPPDPYGERSHWIQLDEMESSQSHLPEDYEQQPPSAAPSVHHHGQPQMTDAPPPPSDPYHVVVRTDVRVNYDGGEQR